MTKIIPRVHPATIFRLIITIIVGTLTATFINAGTLVSAGGQWKVRQVNTFISPTSIDIAEDVLLGFSNSAEACQVVDHIDFGEHGKFSENQPFPGLINGEDSFVVEAIANIHVTTPGNITFGLVSDHTARLSIDGVELVTKATSLTSFGTVNLVAGTHSVRVVYYETTGDQELEIFIATELGTFTEIGATTFELLDASGSYAPTSITPPQMSFPANAVASAVVAEMAPVGGTGSSYTFKIGYALDSSPTELISAATTWTYLDDGTEPATDWTEAAFDDAAWSTGTAPLGYGDPAPTTAIEMGPKESTRHPTYYFRKQCTLPAGELARVDALRIRLQRDDGAIIYLNEVEVLRTGMAEGAVDYTTLANQTTTGAMETTFFEFEIDPAALVEGENVIAVEVHQANLVSSDLIFDMVLEYDRRTNINGDEQYFAIDGNQLILAQDAASIPALEGNELNLNIRVTDECGASFEAAFIPTVTAAQSVLPTDIALDNSNVPETASIGTIVGLFSATDTDSSGAHAFTLVLNETYPDNSYFSITGSQLRTADALDPASYEIGVQATDPTGNTFTESLTVTVDPVDSLITLSPNTLPVNALAHSAVGTLDTTDAFATSHSYRLISPLAPTPTTLISFGDTWKYLDDGSNQGAAWTALTFDDSAWVAGAAPLGYGDHDGASPTTTVSFGLDADNKYATTYFRKSFSITDPNVVDSLEFEIAVDDGAVFYLNGIELIPHVRANDVDSFDDYTGEGDGGEGNHVSLLLNTTINQILRAGTNVLSVEVHQTAANSSDIWLDMSLQAHLRASGTDADHFYISGDQVFLNKAAGVSPLLNGVAFTLNVESTNEFDEGITDTVVITIDDSATNTATDIQLSNDTMAEKSPALTIIGELTAALIDSGAFTYSLPIDASYPDNSQFMAAGGQLVTTTSLDYDDGATRSILIRSTGNTGAYIEEAFTINVNLVQQAPTLITLSNRSFAYDDDSGTTIGLLDAVDENEAELHTFIPWPEQLGTPIITNGSTWKYLDDGSDQGTACTAPLFDDTGWPSGSAELGYGDGDEATVVGFIDTDTETPDIQKNATTYFRHTFDIPSLNGINGARVHVTLDDAVAVYLNGTEIYRSANLAAAALYDDYASSGVTDDTIETFVIADGLLLQGSNTLAVEVHQWSATSSDVSFDLLLQPIETNPYASYFTINENALVTNVDFLTTSVTPPHIFEIPIVAEDPGGNMIQQTFSIAMSTPSYDTDFDGLLDDWEITHFGDLSANSTDNADNDRDTNEQEQTAGTDPNDPADFLHITSINIVGGMPRIEWEGVQGPSYSIYYRNDLSSGTWLLLEDSITTETPDTLTKDDPEVPLPSKRFYLLEAQAAPLP